MNLALRKIAMLEKNMIQKEEEARINGYASSPIDKEFRNKVFALMEKVRAI